MISPEPSGPQYDLKLKRNAFILYCMIVIGFTCIYMLYSTIVADDFTLTRDQYVDTFINCAYMSVFVTTGSMPIQTDARSSLSRMLLVMHALLAGAMKIWIVTS